MLFMEVQLKAAQSVTCDMGSHSVTFHPTRGNALCFKPSQAGRRVKGRVNLGGWLHGLPVYRQSPIQVVTEPSVEQHR